MKKILFIAIAAASLAASNFSMAGHHGECQGHKCKLMKRADTNGDGVISKAEFMANSEKRFAKMDTDNNGELSAEELKAGRSKMKANKAKMMEHKGKPAEKPAE